MMTTRRAVLGLGAAGVGAVALAKVGGIGAPAIVKGEITPQQFGATGGDPVRDTAGWNRAVQAAARAGRPVVASGTYALRVPARSSWNWWNDPQKPVRIAVELLSGTHIVASKAEILVAPPEQAPVRNEKHFLFGTGLNLDAGTLRDISVEGLTFDFSEELGAVHGMTYGVGATGVDGLTRRNLVLRSTGQRRGRGLLSENVRGRSDTGIRHDNVIQGTYTRYEKGVTMRDIRFDGFNEALDYDGPCWDVDMRQLVFLNGVGEAQCIDTGGGARWTIDGVVAEKVGAVMYIYSKGLCWPTYRQWMEHGRTTTPDAVPPEQFVVRNVRGKQAGLGRTGELLRVGTPRKREEQQLFQDPRDIRIEDWAVDGSGAITVNDCRDLAMRRITLTDVHRPQGKRDSVLSVQEGHPAYGGAITGVVEDVTVRGAEANVTIVGGEGLQTRRIRVEGAQNGSDALQVRSRPGQTGRPRSSDLSVNGRPI